ncbi:HAMP domain-containing protein [Nonomuraea phyllanthi]|nr:HAMP domain-containing protein [Nonomuraea phyllanthi]
MSVRSRPHSIQARYTLVAALFAITVLVTLGTITDLAIRYQVASNAFDEAERVASQWSAAARNDSVPRPIPAAAPVEFIQVVDVHGRVVESSKTASETVPLSLRRPPPDDRFQQYTECPSPDHCLLLQAIRLFPAQDASVVYAGLAEPALLATHRLEYAVAAGTILIAGVVGWTTWMQVGRTLRPVKAISTKISQITVSDLSVRIPVPPGDDEVAQLATTANETLSQLEGAVEQLRQFALTTSHELRTPIAGLRAHLEEALFYPDDVDTQETIRAALVSTDRLDAIVTDLSLLARLRAEDRQLPERIDVGELVTAEVHAQSGPVPMSVTAASGLWIHGSRMQLIRVLANLLANAQRHAASSIEVTVEEADGGAAITVSDDGNGVPPADRERIFERFVRLDDSRRLDAGGSGLGLAISRDIAQAHHGTLKAADSSGGARFVLWLPLIKEDLTHPEA